MILIKNTYFALTIFMLFGLFLSCEKENEALLKEINTYHKEISNTTEDNLIDIDQLKKYQDLIDEDQNFPDSIKAENSYLIGTYFFQKAKTDSAAIYLHKATTFGDSLNFNDRNATYFYGLWDCYNIQGKFGDCIAVSDRFKTFVNFDEDFENAALSYYFDEQNYLFIGDIQNSLKYNKKRIAVLEGNDDDAKSRALIAQATLKNYLNDRRGALTILDSLIAESHRFTNDFNREVYGNYGYFLFFENRIPEALEYYKKALRFTKKVSDPNLLQQKKADIAISYNNIAEAHIELKQYKFAQKYLDSVKIIGYQNVRSNTLKQTLKYQIKLDFATKKKQHAIKTVDSIFDHIDIAYKKKFQEELDDLVESTKNEKNLLEKNKETEVANLELRSQLFALVLGSVIVLLIGIILYNRNRFKHKKEKLFINQQLFRSQMNPHFTFNALYVIQSYITTDPSVAKNYLMKFSRLLRLTLENSLSNYVVLENELESLKKYMELQSLRFPDKFEYTISLEKTLNPEEVSIPPMLIQPFV